MFHSHHGVIAQALLDQRVAFAYSGITQMAGWCYRGAGPGGAILGRGRHRPNWARPRHLPDSRGAGRRSPAGRDPGVSVRPAIVIIAEIRLNMASFPTPAHLVSWTGPRRSAAESGTRRGKGSLKKGKQPRLCCCWAGRSSAWWECHALPRRAGTPASPPAAAGRSPRSRSPVRS